MFEGTVVFDCPRCDLDWPMDLVDWFSDLIGVEIKDPIRIKHGFKVFVRTGSQDSHACFARPSMSQFAQGVCVCAINGRCELVGDEKIAGLGLVHGARKGEAGEFADR